MSRVGFQGFEASTTKTLLVLATHVLEGLFAQFDAGTPAACEPYLAREFTIAPLTRSFAS